jgi:hypothetical protein
MAEKRTVELEIKDNSKSLKAQLKEAVMEVQKLSDAYGATSAQAIEAAKRAGQLKDRISDSADLVKAFNPDAKFNALSKSLGGVLDGFQAFEGALGLVGVEGEAVQATLLKVQSAMALSQGLQGLGEAKDSFIQLGGVIKDSWKGLMVAIGIKKTDIAVTNAQKLAATEQMVATEGQIVATEAATVAQEGLNVAVSVNPYVLIAGAIAAVVGSVYVFRNEITKAFGFFDKLGPKTKIAVGIIMLAFAPLVVIIYGVFKALEALGVKDDANTVQMKANAAKRSAAMAKEADDNIQKFRQVQKVKTDAYDFEIRMAEATGKNTDDLEKKKRMSIYMTGMSIFKEQKRKEKGFVEEYKYYRKIGQLDDERAQKLLKNIKKIRGEQYAQYLENKKINQDIKVAEAERQQAAADAYREKRKQQIDAVNGLKAELEAVRQENIAASKTALKRDLDAVDTKYDLLKQRAINNKLDFTEIEKARVREIDAINKADAASKLEAEKKLIADMKAIDDADWNERKNQIEIKNKYIVDDKERELANIKLGLDEELVTLQNQLDAKQITQAQYDEYTKIAAARSAEEVAAINKNAADKELAKLKAIQDQKRELIMQDLELASQGIQLIASLGEKNKKLQKAAILAESAVGIAKTIIQTKAGNQAARAAGVALSIETAGASVVAAEALILRNNIGAGLSIAANIAATAKAVQSLGGGSSPTDTGGGNTGGGDTGGGGGGGGVISPSFNVVGNNGINQLAQLQQQPLQAYVVSGEVTSAQALDRNRMKNATL